MKSKIALAAGVMAGVLAALSATLIAGSVTLPYTFTSGTPARASEVNGNFSAVKTAVDDNAARITTLETVVTPAGNVVLGSSTATTGNILKGTVRFIHDFGTSNTFIGAFAGNFTMTGLGGNTATGAQALQGNVTGSSNTATGANALSRNTTGSSNTATGYFSLFANTTGTANTASGQNALAGNTDGHQNTATGFDALRNNSGGIQNTAHGAFALTNNTTGSNNTASGLLSLLSNTTGVENTAIGVQALRQNTAGDFNTAIGRNSMFSNTIGGSNTAGGATALANNTNGSNNTAFGANALLNTTGSNNIAIGFQAGSSLTMGNGNIAIANSGVAGESSTIRIGSVQNRVFISGIRNVTTANANAINVVIDAAGQLGTLSSSRRVKDDIAGMGEASSALMKLRPVTFHYKTDRDPAGRALQYGLVAEEVAAVAPGLVARSGEGRIETVYYQFLAPMLLNEYQKQQRTIEAQAAELARQRTRIAELEQERRLQAARLEALERQGMEFAELKQQSARMATLLDRLVRAEKVATSSP